VPVVLLIVVGVVTSRISGRAFVTHECPPSAAVTGVVSPSLIVDRHLMFAATDRVYRPRVYRSPASVLVELLLLLGGVESNPVPTSAFNRTHRGTT